VQERLKRQNHKSAQVSELLAVPRYADIVDEEAADSDAGEDNEHSGQRPTGLIKSKEKWRQEMAKWVQAEHALGTDTDDSQDELTNASCTPQNHQPRRGGTKWLPRTLDLLFAG